MPRSPVQNLRSGRSRCRRETAPGGAVGRKRRTRPSHQPGGPRFHAAARVSDRARLGGATIMKLAWIGLGVMGYPMAGHLARAGHEMTVYNRTRAKADQWVKEYGGCAVSTPREAAQGADIVFSCVGNDQDLRAVTLGSDGAFAGLKKGALYIDHSTVSANVA